MTKQEFELTKRIYEVLIDLKMLDPQQSKLRPAWENRLYEWSEGFAKQIVSEFSKL